MSVEYWLFSQTTMLISNWLFPAQVLLSILCTMLMYIDQTAQINIPSIFVSRASYFGLLALAQRHPIKISIITSTVPDLPLLDALFLLLLVFTLALTYLIVSFRSSIRQITPLNIIKALPKGRWTSENTIQQLPQGATRKVYGYHFHPHRPMALECVICLADF